MEHRQQVLGLKKKMEEKLKVNRRREVCKGKMGVERKMKGLLSENMMQI